MTLQQMWRLLPQRLAYGHETGDYDPVMSLVLELANAWYAYRFPHAPRVDREDWAQEACLRFWERIHTIRPDTSNRYLIRILFTCYIDMNRRPSICVPCDPHATVFTCAVYFSDDDYNEACFDADMRQILNDDEYALLQSYLKGYSIREYAHQTQIAVRKAYGIAHSLKEKIRTYTGCDDHDDTV